MKSNLYSNLAEQIKTNPSAFADMDEMLLRESILQFHEGKLNESESAEVSALIQLNPHARSILDGILAAEHYGASANGKAWLDGLLERVIAETPVARESAHTNLFDRISDKASEFLQAAQTLISPKQALMASTKADPIHGKVGPDDEVMYTMRPTSSGLTEISLTTKSKAWSKLEVKIGEVPQTIELELVGLVWAGCLVFSQHFATLESLRPV
ncbi:MAG: hypothetical protein NTV80_11020, partial [Verrucomicrobia bacterium]|nr:hypothetical protein [Verrucomicrobiota bacterium]